MSKTLGALTSPRPHELVPELKAISLSIGATAYMAGGALRDYFHQVPIKDYDVFVPAEHLSATTGDQIAEDLGNGWEFEGELDTDYFSEDMAAECGPIMSFRHPRMLPPLQLIGLRLKVGRDWSMEGILDRIDIGFCRIGMDWNGSIYSHPAYTRDALNRTLTIVDRRDVRRSTLRARRINKKYPGFGIVGGCDTTTS